MERYLERVLVAIFPVVVLVGAHAIGVPFAREAAVLAILGGGTLLGLERLVGERSRLDLLAGVLLPAGAVVGAVLGVFRFGDLAMAFVPLLPGLVALYAARGDFPVRVWPPALERSRYYRRPDRRSDPNPRY